MGVQIVGVSTGSPEDLQSWADQEGFQYELWQDDSRGMLATRYSADDGWFGAYARITVLLDAEGKLILEYNEISDFSPGAHPEEVLADCQQIFGN